MLLDRLKAMLDAGRRAVPDAPPDWRGDPRRKVMLKAMVLPVAAYADLRIVDVSRTGFGGETAAVLHATDPIVFSVEGDRFHQGTVRWVRGGKFGADLDDALDILTCFDDIDPGVLASHTTRARRYPVERTGRIAIGSLPLPATVRDMSQSGMRLELGAALDVGQHVIVRLADRPLILATVRWHTNQMTGVEMAERMQTLRLVYASEA